MGTTRQRLLGLAVLLGALLLLLLAMASLQAHSTSKTVLICAVYYDTYLTDEPDEAFRLTNVSASPMELNGWEITDGEGTIALDATGSLDAGNSLSDGSATVNTGSSCVSFQSRNRAEVGRRLF